MKKLGIGLYGRNGHQVHGLLRDHPRARCTAVAAWDEACPEGARMHVDLDGLLGDPEVALVVFCSPRRDEQGGHILRCLQSGKHALAEKPCCMDVDTLDRILECARRGPARFHEMAGTALESPWRGMRDCIRSGAIGEVLQVFSQKSYPWGDWRPEDEGVDGGLALQVGVYNMRFAEHVAGMRIRSARMEPSAHPVRAVSFIMTFENGAVGSAIANYACPAPPGWSGWGYDIVRVFGTEGFVEAVDGGRITTLARNGCRPEPLISPPDDSSWFDRVVDEALDGTGDFPWTPEEELRPTRWALLAGGRA
ncbi:MAG: Gfo/Idh/MocA family oxidoreductase [Verrucomicrobia bacterium]|nr:Gfo/Idh/MocA family oxidoreductase [Verrucomicrobiota bacterium]MCH8526198.1 Gfo/Idh/MocA family oxidoreductase [Kiritimatiellia bacterium]